MSCNLTEDLVVEIPRLIKIAYLTRSPERVAPVTSFLEFPTEGLNEADLAERLWPLVEHGVQRRERCKHAIDVMIAEVQSTRFLETFVPLFMPEYCNADELVTDKISLFNEARRVFAHCFHELLCRPLASGYIRLHTDSQWEDEGLGMRLADFDQ